MRTGSREYMAKANRWEMAHSKRDGTNHGLLLMWPLDNISGRFPVAPPYQRPALTKGVAYRLDSPTPKKYRGFCLFLSAIEMAHH